MQDIFGTALCTTSMALMSSSAMRNIDGQGVQDIFCMSLCITFMALMSSSRNAQHRWTGCAGYFCSCPVDKIDLSGDLHPSGCHFMAPRRLVWPLNSHGDA
jgi:hypothetical protein